MSNIEIEFQSATYPQHSRQAFTRHGSPTSTIICFRSCAHASSSQFHLAYVSKVLIKLADCKTFSLGAGSGCPLPRQTSSVSPQHRISNCASSLTALVSAAGSVAQLFQPTCPPCVFLPWLWRHAMCGCDHESLVEDTSTNSTVSCCRTACELASCVASCARSGIVPPLFPML